MQASCGWVAAAAVFGRDAIPILSQDEALLQYVETVIFNIIFL